MLNRLILVGNLTKNPELRYTPSGFPVATLSVATNSRFKQGDEVKEEVLFLDAVVFGKQAEICEKYLGKGAPVLVEGRLRERRWEHDGQRRSKFEVLANTVRFMPSGKLKANGDNTKVMK